MKLVTRSPRKFSAAITRGLYGLAALVLAITAFTPLASAYVPETGSSPSILPSKIGTIGDSISVGFNTVTRNTKTVANNWATGSNSSVNSIARRIATVKNNSNITIYDKAVAGKESAGIGPQVTAINSASPDLTTFFIGNNDICSNDTVGAMTSTTAFRSNVRQALRGINSDIKILAVGVVDMQNLYEIGRDDSDIRSVWAQYNVCTVMLGNPLSTAQADVDRRATVNQRVKDFNTAIKEECGQLDNCVYDGDAVYNTDFSKEDLSPYDYFHPSISGQKKIAAATWTAFQKFYPNVFGGDGGTPVGDAVAPSVSITAPTAGATISGTFNLTASATDNVDVASVKFYADGTLLGSATEISNNVWRLAYNTSTAPNDTYSLTAKATDTSGNVRTSTAVSATINNGGTTTPPPSGNDTTAPSVAITSPSNGQNISGTVTLTANATDNVAIATNGVKFYADNSTTPLSGTVSKSGNVYSLNFNTSGVTGTHTFYAKATDTSGNTKSSSVVTVTVNGSSSGNDTIDPTVTILSPTNGTVVSSNVFTLTMSASDNVGVQSVRVYVDNSYGYATKSNNQWTYKVVVPQGYQYACVYVTAFDAAGNSSATASGKYRNGAALSSDIPRCQSDVSTAGN